MASGPERVQIPGRKHLAVRVDFGNAFLRKYMRTYPETHRRLLDDAGERTAVYLQRAPKDQRPLAAVLDIDELILGNIHQNVYGEFHAADFYRGPDGRPWPRGDFHFNPLLPGALELLKTLRQLGLEVFFVSGRPEAVRDETVENFVFVGISDVSPDRLILRPELSDEPVQPYKEKCRAEIEKTHNIIVNIGDQASDLGLHGFAQILVAQPFYFIP